MRQIRKPSAVPLAANHSLSERFHDASAISDDAEVTKLAAAIVAGAPGEGLNVEENTKYLAGVRSAAVLSAQGRAGLDDAEDEIKLAAQCIHELAIKLQAAEDLQREGPRLADRIVTVGDEQLTTRQIVHRLDQTRAVTNELSSQGHHEHLKSGDPGIWAWLISGLVTGFELLGIYAWLFNAGSAYTTLVMVVVATMLFLGNHFLTKIAGRDIRASRELRETTEAATEKGHRLNQRDPV